MADQVAQRPQIRPKITPKAVTIEETLTESLEDTVAPPVPPVAPAEPAVAIRVPPRAQTYEEICSQLERQVADQLQRIALHPPGAMRVIDFQNDNKVGAEAIDILNEYINKGWVVRSWLDNYGRYALTEEGLAYLNSVKAKTGQ